MVSAASSMRAMFQGPGVVVVARVPSAGPVPPPSIVVMPFERAAHACCGAIMWMWLSTPPGVAIMCSPAMTSVPGPITSAGSTPSMMSGFPALPMAAIRPFFTPMSPLITPSTGSRISALVITRSGLPPAAVIAGACAMPSRIVLPPPNTASSPSTAWSRSTRQISCVSARRKRSPVVGP